MSMFKNISRLEWIDQLIRQERTGNPPAFAKRIGVSVRQLYNILDEMKDLGLPVHYCRLRRTFYYQTKCRLVVTIRVEEMSQGQKALSVNARNADSE
ncbi:MAG: hypothetical protein JXA61_00890 [Bacteroidales bacterium]|nr:hypothetical protein [Bacteroidales bacterium]